MKQHVWIVGRGLLGSALASRLSQEPNIEIFQAPAFTWNDAEVFKQQCKAVVREFSDLVAREKSTYRIFWSAGRGIMSSSEEDMRKETENFASFLQALNADPNLQKTRGIFCFASSAGAVYAGSRDDVISETSVVSPLAPYGRAKCEQEKLAHALVNPQRGVLIARISNLYGPGQSRTKKQGLLTHIARCILMRQPIHIFVPFDTVRDYIHVSDAAEEFVRTSALVLPGSGITKIIASEEPATIAMIIGLFRRITRKNPLLVTGTSDHAPTYPHRMRFQSNVLSSAQPKNHTSLPEGIAETFAHERTAYSTSGMP